MILCWVVRPPALRAAAASLPQAPLLGSPTPVEELHRLRAALGSAPRLLVKRDDAIPFGFGGNKVRKLSLVAGQALAEGADTLITCGGVQSNHARVTAAAAAKLGLKCVIVANGTEPQTATGNALLDRLLGAEVHYVAGRGDRAPAMDSIAHRLRQAGHRPLVIPLGASTPLGAVGFALAVAELAEQIDPPAAIVHASSSGGTQAGLVAGCAALGWKTRVIGISADETRDALADTVASIVQGMRTVVPELGAIAIDAPRPEVDDRFVGAGYGIPTDASREAQALAATTEALFLDQTYTAKAMAGLIALCRSGAFAATDTVLFWHTGGLPGLFA
ncbi:MAG TPA: D-cysteine desulfhydrase family protein [Vicinamibacterales bacterium]|nr:D-cysteine desulfhydrase family protein [Vicinamibacterales bacterium]